MNGFIIVCCCLSNICVAFKPQLCNILIINDFYILFRQVKFQTNTMQFRNSIILYYETICAKSIEQRTRSIWGFNVLYLAVTI